jgi:signal transduction histidine kinase
MPIFEAGRAVDALFNAGDFLDAGVLTVDTTLVIRGWNRWLEVASGRSAAEMVGRPLLTAFPDLAGTRVEAAFRRALQGETVILAHHFHQYLIPLAPGPDFPAFERMQQSARLAPIFSSGRLEGAVAIIQDVTERVAREAELRLATERAESASRAKSEFMASMSHELRTPLGAIIGYSELLETEVVGPLAEPQKEQMRRVKAGAWHILGIIEQILTFSRVDAGREIVYPEPVDPAAIATEAISMVEPQAQQKGLTVSSTVPDAPVEARTDAGKLRQILVNLLGNAVKFTEKGEIALRVWTDPRMVYFEVRDTGLGIPPEYLERVFEPFTQVDSADSRVRGGTGLGLPVSRRLARLLGGDLEVESVVGEGSRFTLSLPLIPSPTLPVAPGDEP